MKLSLVLGLAVLASAAAAAEQQQQEPEQNAAQAAPLEPLFPDSQDEEELRMLEYEMRSDNVFARDGDMARVDAARVDAARVDAARMDAARMDAARMDARFDHRDRDLEFDAAKNKNDGKKPQGLRRGGHHDGPEHRDAEFDAAAASGEGELLEDSEDFNYFGVPMP